MKKTIIFILSLLFLLEIAVFGSAYSYTPLSSSESQYGIFPKYQNFPTLNDKYSNSNFASSSANRNYQGPLMERTIKYDQFFERTRRGRITQTSSFLQTERYQGPTLLESSASENRAQNSREYSNIPTNPSIYDAGSSWRNKELFTYNAYGRDSYSQPYYYSPRYTGSYFDWRY